MSEDFTYFCCHMEAMMVFASYSHYEYRVVDYGEIKKLKINKHQIHRYTYTIG